MSRKEKKKNSFMRSENPNSSKGTIYDPVASQRPTAETILTQREIDILYYDNRFCRRILEDIARTSVKSGFRVKIGDNTYDEDIVKRWAELELDDYVTELLTHGQKDGISFLYPVITARGEIETKDKLDYGKISTIEGFNLFYADDLVNMSRQLDKFRTNYGYINWCEFSNVTGETSVVRVDSSWLIDYEPNRRHDKFMQQGVSFGDSYYKSIYDLLIVKDSGIWSAGQLAYAMLLKVVKFGDQSRLDQILKEMSKDKFKVKMETEINSSTLLMMGKDDEVSGVSFGSGINLKDLKEYIYEEIALATGIPLSKLKGSAAGALASSTEDTKRWYEYIEGYQVDQLDEIIRRLISMLYAEKGKANQKFEIEFNSIRKLDEKEMAEINKLRAETLKLEIDALINLSNNQKDDELSKMIENLKDKIKAKYDYGTFKYEEVL